MWINICDREPFIVKSYQVKTDAGRTVAMWLNGKFWKDGEVLAVCQWKDE